MAIQPVNNPSAKHQMPNYELDKDFCFWVFPSKAELNLVKKWLFVWLKSGCQILFCSTTTSRYLALISQPAKPNKNRIATHKTHLYLYTISVFIALIFSYLCHCFIEGVLACKTLVDTFRRKSCWWKNTNSGVKNLSLERS